MAHPPSKEGPRHRFQDQIFYAWNGVVAVEDQRDGTFKTMPRADFAARAVAFNEALKQKWDCFYDDERTALGRAVVEMCECVKEAKDQGDPYDPEAMTRVARENRTVSFSPSTDVGTDIRIPHAAKSKNTVYFLPEQGGVLLRSEIFKEIRI